MYKVALIDDEERIVNGLQKVIEWEKYDCQVVALAHDAKKGAALIREYHPQILFTDIRMNEETGLEMLAGLRSEFPDLQVTVISGYTDFDYVQEAMRLGVRRYLQKPTKIDEINEALEFMCNKLKHLSEEKTQGIIDSVGKQEVQESNSFIVKNALNFMEKNYKNKITLTEVADEVFISQWHLSKLLNKHTNKTFYDIINELRIKEAKELLNNPGLRISDIAIMVGYSDAAHFSKIFKKESGVSAKEFRTTLVNES